MRRTGVRFRRESSRWWDLHEQIRLGQSLWVKEALKKIARRGVPPAERAEFANLSWRSGAPELGVRVLCPILNRGSRRKQAISSAETVEYAACLVRLGASDEALRLLQQLNRNEVREVSLYEAYALIAKWDYAGAIPHLKAYLHGGISGSYEKLVAEVNLAAALVYERQYFKAEVLLRRLLHEASVQKLPFAMGTVLELSAGNFILQRELGKASPLLDRAERELGQGGDLVPFFVSKWRAILYFLQSPRKNRRKLDAVRQKATTISHWETIRDCDRFEAIELKDEALARQLYFGTPYPSFRERLLRDFGPLPHLDEFHWHLGKGKSSGITLDLSTAEIAGRAETLKPGALSHRLLGVLASDFYRPFRVAQLHAALYENSYFNPLTAPDQVHIAVRRLRKWLRVGGIPIEVVEAGGAYRLRAAVRTTLIVKAATNRKSHALVARLEKVFATREFSVNEASLALSLSRRSVQRLLAKAEQEGSVYRSGRGSASRYRCSSPPV